MKDLPERGKARGWYGGSDQTPQHQTNRGSGQISPLDFRRDGPGAVGPKVTCRPDLANECRQTTPARRDFRLY